MMTQRGSLPEAIIQFSEAVEKMNKTILVPRRLIDLPEDSLTKPPSRHHMNEDCSKEENCQDSEMVKNYKKENVEAGLFGVYQMLLDVKEEVLTGRPAEVEGCFRVHVEAVLDALKHMTVLAQEVTSHYCEVCEDRASNGSCCNFISPDMNGNDLGLKAYRERKKSWIS